MIEFIKEIIHDPYRLMKYLPEGIAKNYIEVISTLKERAIDTNTIKIDDTKVAYYYWLYIADGETPMNAVIRAILDWLVIDLFSSNLAE